MKKQFCLCLLPLLATTMIFSQNIGFKNLQKSPKSNSQLGFTIQSVSPNGKQQLPKAKIVSSVYSSTQLSLKDLNTDPLNNIQFSAGKLIYCERAKSKSIISQTNSQRFYSFHNAAKKVTRLLNPTDELKIESENIDELGISHIKAQQYLKGIKVYGGQTSLHLNATKEIMTGHIQTVDTTISIVPELSKSNVLNIVLTDLKSKRKARELSAEEKKILNYESPEISLLIYENRLAFEIKIRPNFIDDWRYYVDAKNGQILLSYNNTNNDGPATATGYDLNGVSQNINTLLISGTYYLINASESMFNTTTGNGIIKTFDAKNSSFENFTGTPITSANNVWSSTIAISAHSNAKKAYQYFKNTFGRNSIDGKGGNIVSLINVTDENSKPLDNAFWNGAMMLYGNGNTNFKPLAGGLDVAAHEMGHGVISNTANLIYQGQSGAINESFADIFGAMVDRNDWLIGEDIVKLSAFPSGALRSISDPHNGGTSLSSKGWQPKHMTEFVSGVVLNNYPDRDNEGVHINSGICNYVYYLFATAVTKEKAEQVYYRALVNYLQSNSQFIDLRLAVIQSAKDLYGETSVEVSKAKQAFDTVGIYEETTVNHQQDYSANPGQDYLLIVNSDPLDPNSIYRCSTTGTNLIPLTTGGVKNKPSITDDGTLAYFVGLDHNIYKLTLNPTTVTAISNNGMWDNVAISKDGKRFACITTQIDTAIYVYDLVSQSAVKYHLFNPTNEGTSTGGVLYADALEFDHTGEYLIYDAYSQINSTNGSNISYWDIALLNVWDNAKNTFGNGSIQKPLGNLPADVSIGNPTFSKNSPYIIAFDYMNSTTNSYAVVGANLLTNDLGVVVSNNTIGFPSYSKNDDKVAFSSLDTNKKHIVGAISLNLDKINGNGTASLLIQDGYLPSYYTVGKRTLGLAPSANFTADYKSGFKPLTVRFMDLSANEPTTWSWTFQGGNPSTSSSQNPTVVYNSNGTYQVSLTCANLFGNNTLTRTSYISVELTNSLNSVSQLISFYPNPVKNTLLIASEKDFELKLYDISGNMVIYVINQKEVDLSKLRKGVYILQMVVDGQILNNKLIRE